MSGRCDQGIACTWRADVGKNINERQEAEPNKTGQCVVLSQGCHGGKEELFFLSSQAKQGLR